MYRTDKLWFFIIIPFVCMIIFGYVLNIWGEDINERNFDSKQHTFCEECCWYWKQTNTKLFTCAETKEKLWRHVP